MKEDVEKSIPPKTETIIHVELTTLQVLYSDSFGVAHLCRRSRCCCPH